MRLVVASGLVMACVLAVQAHAATVNAAETLGCLTKEGDTPQLAAHLLRRPGPIEGTVRVQLRFSRPDAAPEVVILVNTASEAMQDFVYASVKRYRLPCLPADGDAVLAVQQFRFDGAVAERVTVSNLSPFEQARQHDGEPCLVKPRQAPPSHFTGATPIPSKVLAVLRFDGDGNAPPTVMIQHAQGDPAFADAVIAYGKQYRMPCRQAGDKPVHGEQLFVLGFDRIKDARFVDERVPLSKFLTWVKDRQQLHASFDFDTMNCPFRVRWHFRRPALPNSVVDLGTPNPRRDAFLTWMAKLETMVNPRDAVNLFDESIDVDIPCGQLKLEPGQ